MSLYTQVEFPMSVNVQPRALHRGFYHELEKIARQQLDGRCHPNVGYIKKGTVQIVKKQLAKHEGSHLTGNVTVHMQVRCMAAMPVVGQKLPCMVITKNEYGILATNYQLPSYTMLIMKMPDDTSDAQDRIQRGSYIEVEILAVRLKAENPAERIRSEYWLICSLANAKVEENRYQILPPVSTRPQLIANNKTYDLETIDEKRRELTGGAYADLEDTKNSIQQIRDDYIKMLQEDPSNVKNDIMLSSMLGKNRDRFILGVLKEVRERVAIPGKKQTAIHKVKVLWSSLSTLKHGDTFSPEVTVNVETLNLGSVILYQNYEEGVADSYHVLDFWGRHVKYVINDTEMVHPNSQYLTQLTKIIHGHSKGIKSEQKGQRKVFVEYAKPVATIIYRDPHVINRAYYKMREFISFFGEELFPRQSMKIACIAECPGGFIQALLDHRGYDPTGPKVETGIRDHIIAMSIGINCPPWKQLEETIRKFKYDYVHLRSEERDTHDDNPVPGKTNVLLLGGRIKDNGEGNILDADNRDRFYLEFSGQDGQEGQEGQDGESAIINLIESKADLVTGDAGIERNKKETSEEMDTHRLLLAEIIMALTCQKRGGSFILKIYDMATEFTMNMLQVLSYCYDQVGLFKPDMSRAASSEKYVICKRFQLRDGERSAIIEHLEKIHKIEASGDDVYGYYGNMVSSEDVKLKQAIVSYNNYYMKKQIAFIENGRTYSTLYNNTIRSGNVEQMTIDILAKIGTQVSTADEFAAQIAH